MVPALDNLDGKSQLPSMHRIRRINLILPPFDKENNRNTEEEHHPEVHKNIHIGHYGTLL